MASIDIGFLTCKDLPNLDEESQHLFPALTEAGLTYEPLVWNDPSIDASRYRMIVIRSPWDYTYHQADFLAVLNRLNQTTPVYNSPAVVAWNSNKLYLKEFEAAGIAIVPTIWLPEETTPLTQAEWESWFKTFETDRLVIKPTVSASSRDTYKIGPTDFQAVAPQIDPVKAHKAFMVQPYLSTIETVGEYSLFFFGGEFSHAIVKKPAAGDYRVQEAFGANIQAYAPDANLTQFAKAVLNSVPKQFEAPLLYARVDIMRHDKGHYCLAELEIIEPSLYLSFGKDASRKFCAVLTDFLS